MAAAAALWVYLVDLTGSEVPNHINQSVACIPSAVLDQWKSTRVTDLVTILAYFNRNANKSAHVNPTVRKGRRPTPPKVPPTVAPISSCLASSSLFDHGVVSAPPGRPLFVVFLTRQKYQDLFPRPFNGG